ncbi:alpha/beta fold hydrolase [Trichothermofontia sp.]
MTALDLGWQHRFIETNHVRLHYVTQGEGELVVLLHGFPEFWYSWRFQIPALARYFKVVAPDLRGYNDSEKPSSGYDLDTLATDIQGLIQQLGYLKAHVIGHDWGGTIAWHMAQLFPDCLNRLAILNAPHPQRLRQLLLTSPEQWQRSWYLFAFQIPGLPEWVIRQNLPEFVKRLFQDYAVRKGAFSTEDTQPYQTALAKPGALSAALNYYRQLFWTWLQQGARSLTPITAPTLVLWGEEDAFLSPALLQGLESFVKAPLQIQPIPHCGHWIQMEAPQTVNRALIEFLRGKPAKP